MARRETRRRAWRGAPRVRLADDTQPAPARLAQHLPCAGAAIARRQTGTKRGRVAPLAHFFLKELALVDFQLAVVGEADRVALQRPRGRALEVDAVLVKAAAVAGALELLLAFEPVGRAAQVRADASAGRRSPACRCTRSCTTHTPNCGLNLVSTWPGAKLLGKPTLNLLGGSVSTLGNMNRAVPSVHRPKRRGQRREADAQERARASCRSGNCGALVGSPAPWLWAWHSRAWPASAERRPAASRLGARLGGRRLERRFGLRHRAGLSRVAGLGQNAAGVFRSAAATRLGRFGAAFAAAGLAAAAFLARRRLAGRRRPVSRRRAGWRRLLFRRAPRPSYRPRSCVRRRQLWRRALRLAAWRLGAAFRLRLHRRLGGRRFGGAAAGCRLLAAGLSRHLILRAAAKISATDIFFLSAMPNTLRPDVFDLHRIAIPRPVGRSSTRH